MPQWILLDKCHKRQMKTKDNCEHNAARTVKDQSNLSKTKSKNSSSLNNLKRNSPRPSGPNLRKMLLNNSKDTKLQRSKSCPIISNGRLWLRGAVKIK